MFTKFLEKKLPNKPVDKLLGEPTIVTYDILEYQVAVAASAVKNRNGAGNTAIWHSSSTSKNAV